MKEAWYDSDNPSRLARGAGWRIAVAVLAVMVVAGIVGAVIWAIGVGTSDVAGEGNAIRQKNSAENRTQAQAQFESQYNQVKMFDQQLTDAQKRLDDFNRAHPQVGNGSVYDPAAEQQANLSRTVTGLQQQCQRTVADYNARAETFTQEDFRDSSLPAQIGTGDPSTDCRANLAN